jgi:PAS domain S-box-containing protein
MRAFFKPRSISIQLMASYLGLALIAVLAVGIPAILITRNQMEAQTWAQLDQGVQTSLALYSANEQELKNLAKLIAQRPTLAELIDQQKAQTLLSYLLVLQEGTNLDSITICDPSGMILAQTHEFPTQEICSTQQNYRIFQGETTRAWFFSSQPIDQAGTPVGIVTVGRELNDAFSFEMRTRTGLDHSILVSDHYIATSQNYNLDMMNAAQFQEISGSPTPNRMRYRYTLQRTPYYAVRLVYGVENLEIEVALPVGDIIATQGRQAIFLFVSILIVLVLALASGGLLALRISRPLMELSEQVTQAKEADINRPIEVKTNIQEVATVATAFEGARRELSLTLESLEIERDWTNHLLEAIIEGILTLDTDNRIVYFSAGAERITGWSREEILNRPIDEILILTDKSEPFSMDIPEPGEKIFLNVEMADHRQATLSISGARLMPGEASDSQVALVFRDATEEVALNRLLGQFLSSVAHEFRTPLSALAATVELLEDQYPDLAPSEVLELIRSQRLGILGLETLIDNLLESSSIEARRFRVQPQACEVEEIVSEVQRTMAPLIEKHKQSLSLQLAENLPLVNADPRRTAQVLINLVSNAIKYGPAYSEIVIQAQERARKVRVAVSDRGPGISTSYRKEIFTRFNLPRMEDERAKPGAGLGLSVVKAIVEAQGGEVGVEDNPGGGAIFWFTMRLAVKR